MFTSSRPSHRTRRRSGALVAGLAALALVPVWVAEPPAGAAPNDPTALVLTDISGTRIARGGGTGAVHASVANRGSSAVGGVTLRYSMPEGVSFVASVSTPGCMLSGDLVTCPLGTVAAGASAPVDIGVRVADPRAALGDRPGYFLAPTSAGYDEAAGEVLVSTWYHEAGAQGLPLSQCWPIGNDSPNMDVAGGGCDGTNDAPALAPDETAVLDAFPPAYSESVGYSWQFETQITAPATGLYHACGVQIDDGGYLAITPVDQPFSTSSIRVQIDGYSSATGAAFALTGGERYRVLMRVSNRGDAGIDNGSAGGMLGGWTAYGISSASTPCGTSAVMAFGSADRAWVQRTAADVIVVGSSDLSVLGAVESAPVDGVRSVSVRVGNAGPDATGADVALRLPAGATAVGSLSGCDRALSSTACHLDAVDPPATAVGRVVSGAFRSAVGGAGWSIDATSTVDRNPANDEIRLAPPG